MVAGEIRVPRQNPLSDRLHGLLREFQVLVERLGPDTAAVEAPFHGANARAALQLAHARGVILAILAGSGVSPAEYSPATVKKAVTGNGRADKVQVRDMVVRLVGDALPGRSGDVTDAIAIALCHQAASARGSLKRR